MDVEVSVRADTGYWILDPGYTLSIDFFLILELYPVSSIQFQLSSKKLVHRFNTVAYMQFFIHVVNVFSHCFCTDG